MAISPKPTSGQHEFTSTSRAFLVNLTPNSPTYGLPRYLGHLWRVRTCDNISELARTFATG
jgi:hypothetical protein